MNDLREEVIKEVFGKDYFATHDEDDKQLMIEMLDSYFEKRNSEFIDWLCENKVDFDPPATKIPTDKVIWYKGGWITKEQLFQNFL